jgi:hypothetical protein
MFLAKTSNGPSPLWLHHKKIDNKKHWHAHITCIYKVQTHFYTISIFLKVHSHLMFKFVLSENLGGILGGTQC